MFFIKKMTQMYTHTQLQDLNVKRDGVLVLIVLMAIIILIIQWMLVMPNAIFCRGTELIILGKDSLLS